MRGDAGLSQYSNAALRPEHKALPGGARLVLAIFPQRAFRSGPIGGASASVRKLSRPHLALKRGGPVGDAQLAWP